MEAVKQDRSSKEAFKVTLKKCEPQNVYQQWRFGVYTKDYDSLVNNHVLPKHRRTNDMQTFYDNYKSYLADHILL